MNTTIDFQSLVEDARELNDEVPEGWVQTDNLEVIPEVGQFIIVEFAGVKVKATINGYPSIQIRCLNHGTGLSFFENLNFAANKQTNQITLKTLAQLGVPAAIVDEGLDAVAQSLLGTWHCA